MRKSLPLQHRFTGDACSTVVMLANFCSLSCKRMISRLCDYNHNYHTRTILLNLFGCEALTFLSRTCSLRSTHSLMELYWQFLTTPKPYRCVLEENQAFFLSYSTYFQSFCRQMITFCNFQVFGCTMLYVHPKSLVDV